MNKFLIAILILAAILRITALNKHMPALYGDEVSIAYNAWSVLQTGRDEFSKFLPIQFESWGDQKNPVYIYLVSFFQLFMGLNEWSVRLPSALAGIAAVYLTYLLTLKLFEITEFIGVNKRKVALVAALLLAINPWHLHISRGGYEANLALTLGLLAVYSLILHFQKPRRYLLITSLASGVLAMYTYYTTKMFLPLLLVLTFYWLGGLKKRYKKLTISYLATFLILCLPIIYLALFANGQARFATINIFSNPTVVDRIITSRSMFQPSPLVSLLINKPYYWVHDFSEYYLENLSPLFWYVSGDSSLRYHVGNHGMFYLIELPFFLFGLLQLYQRNKKLFTYLCLWLLLAPLPTALVGKSYGLRSIALLPVPFIVTSLGIFETINLIKLRFNSQIRNLAVVGISVLFLVSFVNWLLRYAYLYPIYGYNWYDGMQKDVVLYAQQQSAQYDNVVISRYYGKTEMYFAYYTKMNPQSYQALSTQHSDFANTKMVKFGKYYFGDIDPANLDQVPKNTLILASPLAPYGEGTLKAREDQRAMFKVTTR